MVVTLVLSLKLLLQVLRCFTSTEKLVKSLSHLCQRTFPRYVHKQIILGEMWYRTLFRDAEDVTLDVFCSFDDGLSEVYIPLEKLKSVKLGGPICKTSKKYLFYFRNSGIIYNCSFERK